MKIEINQTNKKQAHYLSRLDTNNKLLNRQGMIINSAVADKGI